MDKATVGCLIVFVAAIFGPILSWWAFELLFGYGQLPFDFPTWVLAYFLLRCSLFYHSSGKS